MIDKKSYAMRCISCHTFSKDLFCPACRDRLLRPSVTQREVGTLSVVSLFAYSAVEPFLLTKHTPLGYRVYRYFAEHFVAPVLYDFARQMEESFSLIAVDENVRHGYAHTALLSRAVSHPKIRVEHGKLLARNRVNYAGKTLQYRLEHPRNFDYTGSTEQSVVLVDDIVTTGITLQEAQLRLHQSGVDVLFALTLADAQR